MSKEFKFSDSDINCKVKNNGCLIVSVLGIETLCIEITKEDSKRLAEYFGFEVIDRQAKLAALDEAERIAREEQERALIETGNYQ